MSLIYSLEQLFDIKNSPLVKKPDRLPDGIGFELTKSEYNKVDCEFNVCNKEGLSNNEIFKTQKSFYTSDITLCALECGSSMSFISKSSKAKNIDNDDSKNATEYSDFCKINGRVMKFLESKDSFRFKVNDEKCINLTRMTHGNSKIIDKSILKDNNDKIIEKNSYKYKTCIGFRNEKCQDYSISMSQDKLLKKSLDKSKILDINILNLKSEAKNCFSDFKIFKTDTKNITMSNVFDNMNLRNHGNLKCETLSDGIVDNDKISALCVSRKTLPIKYQKKRILDVNENSYNFSHNSLESKNVDGGFDFLQSLQNSNVSSLNCSNINSNKTSRFFNFFATDSIKSVRDFGKIKPNALLHTCISDGITNNNFSSRSSSIGSMNKFDHKYEVSRIPFFNSKTEDDVVGFQRIIAMLEKSNQSISNNYSISDYEMVSKNLIYDKNSNIQIKDDIIKYDSIMNKDKSDSIFFMSLLNQSSRLSSSHIGSSKNDNI
ncbi:hypothetical protein PMAC_000479 [Pneumocystis sp. 'macacae']|nr:hypothetical protein PMAC_000479 [Pneumocystis sp. 'macacae']